MLTIDGGLGEGGGQILRTSLSLAALTGKEVVIENIRAGREKPGLRPQHLTGALAVAEICGAHMTGGEVGSGRLTFRPGEIRGGSYEFDVSKIRASAGSVNLILQTILWPLAFVGKKSRVVIKGGTHVPFAPTSDYISETFLPAVADMGLVCHYEMVKAGYYPAGGGEVSLEIRPVEKLRPIQITERHGPVRIELTSAVSNLPESIAQRQLDRGMERIRSIAPHPGPLPQGEREFSVTGGIKSYTSPGKGTVLFASVTAGNVRAGFQSLGALGKRAEKVAEEACDELEAYLASGMALDKHLADQLVIPVALADGPSKFTTCEITGHLLTNISVVERFLDVKFQISGELGQPGLVERLSL